MKKTSYKDKYFHTKKSIGYEEIIFLVATLARAGIGAKARKRLASSVTSGEGV
jgi:hypothetical protein